MPFRALDPEFCVGMGDIEEVESLRWVGSEGVRHKPGQSAFVRPNLGTHADGSQLGCPWCGRCIPLGRMSPRRHRVPAILAPLVLLFALALLVVVAAARAVRWALAHFVTAHHRRNARGDGAARGGQTPNGLVCRLRPRWSDFVLLDQSPVVEAKLRQAAGLAVHSGEVHVLFTDRLQQASVSVPLEVPEAGLLFRVVRLAIRLVRWAEW